MQETSKKQGEYSINSELIIQLAVVVIAFVHLGGTEDRWLLALPSTAGKKMDIGVSAYADQMG